MPNWVEIVLRSFTMLLFLFLIAKLVGKKQLSNLSYFDYVSGIILGGISAVTIIDLKTPFIYGVISIAVFTLFPVLIGFLALKSKWIRDVVNGKGTVLIKDGKILEDNLKKEQYSTDMLLKHLRTKNVFNAYDVEFAVLEPTGEFNVLLKKENQPMTLKDLNVKPAPQKESQAVIMDGKVMDEPLSTLGYNRGWLKAELDKKGVAIENVFLAQVDSYGQLTLDLFDDKIIVPPPTEKPLTLATLRKCQADLEGFLLATESLEAKQMYSKNARKVQEVIDLVTKYLQN